MTERSNLQGHIAYDDLREWLDHAERLGEVRHVKGASWQEDIGLAAEAILRAEDGPCVVFDDIPGCPKGFRLLLNIFAGTRRNMTFGFPDHLTKWELSDNYREAYLKDMKLVPHEIVEDGPATPTPPNLTGDYTQAGVPTFDYVRDRIENRFATSVGMLPVGMSFQLKVETGGPPSLGRSPTALGGPMATRGASGGGGAGSSSRGA